MDTQVENLETHIIACILKIPEFITRVNINQFSIPECKNIIIQLKDLYNKGLDLNFAALTARLSDNDRKYLADYVLDIFVNSPFLSAQHFETYLKTLNEQLKKEEIITMAKDIISNRNVYSVSEMLGKFNKIQSEINTDGLKHISEVIYEEINIPDTAYCKTNYDLIDKHIKLYEGSLITIGGRTSAGKTALGCNLAVNIATSGIPVIFFSIEMPGWQVINRLASIYTKTPKEIVTTLKADYWDKVMDLPIFFDCRTNIFVEDIEDRLYDVNIQEYEKKVLIIDYFQLIQLRNYSRTIEELESITRQLKLIARKHKCVIFLLSQLNREIEKRPNKDPLLSDLRGCGSIEQDSSAVIFIYQKEGEDYIYIAKNREGKVLQIPIDFNRNTGIIEERKEEIND